MALPAWEEAGVRTEGPAVGRGSPGSEGLPSASLRPRVLAGGGLCLAHSPAASGPSHHPRLPQQGPGCWGHSVPPPWAGLPGCSGQP